MPDECRANRERPFEDRPDLGVFVTSDVYDKGEAILQVSHDQDGDWAFSEGRGLPPHLGP